MQLRNYQEEIVLAVIPLVLEDHPDVVADDATIHDVAAYVLNRLPPRYIMSERGLTRIAAENWLLDPDDLPADGSRDRTDPTLLGMVQLLILVNRAVELVKGRRVSRRRDGPQRRGGKRSPDATLDAGYWHNFPQIIGRVLDSKTKTAVVGATVTLRAGRLGLLRTERGWSNPCTVNGETNGYFSLWPRALRDGQESRSLTLRFSFQHPDYEPAIRLCRVRSRGELVAGEELRLDRVINLGTQLMEPSAARGR
jgi:hypothetical protein